MRVIVIRYNSFIKKRHFYVVKHVFGNCKVDLAKREHLKGVRGEKMYFFAFFSIKICGIEKKAVLLQRILVKILPNPTQSALHAAVVESVDTKDLKSFGQ